MDIAEMLGVSRQRAHQIVQGEHFPKPVGTYGEGRYRLRAAKDVRAWGESYRGGAKRWGPRG